MRKPRLLTTPTSSFHRFLARALGRTQCVGSVTMLQCSPMLSTQVRAAFPDFVTTVTIAVSASSLINPWWHTTTPRLDLVRSGKSGYCYSIGNQCLEDVEHEQPRSLMEDILCRSDLYAVLGVDSSVNQNDLRRAYMSLCRRCHPE